MTGTQVPTRHSVPVRIPADVEREDTVLAGMTSRQLAILAIVGVLLYAGWTVTRSLLPTWLYLLAAIPVGVTAAVVALGSRDGVSLDLLLLAALRHRLTPRRRFAAGQAPQPIPDWIHAGLRTTERGSRTRNGTRNDNRSTADGQLDWPAAGFTTADGAASDPVGGGNAETGVVDLGADGVAAIAVCSTVNFALRTQAEQESLVAAFARYLHSLTGPTHILVRAEHLDLSAQITELRERASALPHPALENAALEHAEFLVALNTRADLLRRQVFLVLREPLHMSQSKPQSKPRPSSRSSGVDRGLLGLSTSRSTRTRRPADATATHTGARRAAEARLVRRLNEAIHLLGPAGIAVSPLDAAQTSSVLASACEPGNLATSPTAATAALAGPDDIITTPPAPDDPDDSAGDDWDDNLQPGSENNTREGWAS